MIKMWHVVKESEGMTEAVIFDDELTLKDFLADGYTIKGEYLVTLVKGKELLPCCLES